MSYQLLHEENEAPSEQDDSRRHHIRRSTATSGLSASTLLTRKHALSSLFSPSGLDTLASLTSSCSPATLHTLISFAAGTVMCLFGYEQGVFGGIIVGAEFSDYFKSPSPSMTGFVTSLYDLGCFAGAVLALFIGEVLGRKRMLLLFTVIMAAGILLQAAALNMQHLLWGRLIAGIGNGGNTATAPVWHVETSHHSAKGQAVVKEMVVNVMGFVTSNVITLACSGIRTEAQWRFPLGIQMVYIVIIMVMVPLLPESPRWLLGRGREAEAKAVLTRLNEHDIEEEFAEIRTSVRLEQAAQVSWARIFSGGEATRRILLGTMLQVFQQLSGINVLCYYLPLVLTKSVGLSELAARILATGNAVSFMFATMGALFFIERLGRRPLLMIMAAAQSVAFLGTAISTEIGHDGSAHIPGIVATVFISLFFVAFGFGWAATPWLYPAEINSLSMRTKGAAVATACDWIFNYLVVQTTPIGIHYLHWGLYLIYAIFNAAFIPLIYLLVVETAGKSLEQIDRWFEAHPGWLVHKTYREDAIASGLVSTPTSATALYQNSFDHRHRNQTTPTGRKHVMDDVNLAGSESESMVKDFAERRGSGLFSLQDQGDSDTGSESDGDRRGGS